MKRILPLIITPVIGLIMVGEFFIPHYRYRTLTFYIQEWGTVKQAARPIVGPTAHVFEPIYAHKMGEAVKEACDAR